MDTPTTPTNHSYSPHGLPYAAMILGVTPEYLASCLANNGGDLASAISNNTLDQSNNYTFQPAVVQQRPPRQQSNSPSNSTPSGTPHSLQHQYNALQHFPNLRDMITQAARGASNGLDNEENKPIQQADLAGSIGTNSQSSHNSQDGSVNPYPNVTNNLSLPPTRRHLKRQLPSSDTVPLPRKGRTPIPSAANNELVPIANSRNAPQVYIKDQLSPAIEDDANGAYAAIPWQSSPTNLAHDASCKHLGTESIHASLYLANGGSVCARSPREVSTKGENKNKRQRSNEDMAMVRSKDASASPAGDSANATNSCLRCRFQHLKCVPDPLDLEGPCLNCKGLRRPTLSNLPCYWLMMTEAFLYRDQHAPNPLHTQRWKSMQVVNVEQWQDKETKTVRVGHVAMKKSYLLKVRRFVPLDDAELDEHWVSGDQEIRQRTAPYAIADMREAAKMFKQYINGSVEAYIEAFVENENPLFLNTYRMAYKMAYSGEYTAKIPEPERQLLKDVFSLWVCCRKTSNPERFFGDEKLGVDIVNDPSSPWYNTAPIPPLMIAQMQCIFYSHFLPTLQKNVLERLWSICKGTKRKNWLTVYLAMFILLHSATMITRRNAEYAKSLGHTGRYFNPFAIQKIQEGCNNLLAHFHYFNKGSLPFQLALNGSGMKELTEEAGLDAYQAELIQETAVCTMEKESAWREARDALEFENDDFWISQLYIRKWRKSKTG